MLKSIKRTAAIAVAQTIALGLLPIGALAATFRLEEATIDEVNQAFDAGILTSQQLVQLYLNRIEAYDKQGPSLNSIIAINPNALSEAVALDLERQTMGPRSLLHGIPIVLKDNFNTVDLPTTAGSVLLKDSIPPNDAFVVERFRDAGAIILGKANMSEWAWGSPPSLQGNPLNPYKLNRSPSGSSSGTGVAIAANLGMVGTGSDTGGSVRGPAAVNGLVGIKPTLGLVSRAGIVPLALSFDTGGPMTRTVKDAAITLGFMTGVDPNDPVTFQSEGKFYEDYTQFLNLNALQGARIGVARDFFGGNAEVDAAIESAIATLADLGATVVDDIRVPQAVFDLRGTYPNPGGVWPTINYTEFKVQIAEYLETLGEEYPKTLEEIVALSQSLTNSDTPVSQQTITTLLEPALATGGLSDPAYIDAKENGAPFITSSILNLFDSNNLDAIIYPTSRCPASPFPGVVDPDFVCNPGPSATNLANITGFPDIQVPAGFTSDGLPISISFFGRSFNEPTLLAFSYAFEQTTNFRRPSPLAPALPGETIKSKTVPEPGVPIALATVGIAAFSLKRKKTETLA